LKTIIHTGSAGFIGFSLSKRLIIEGHKVIGIDNINDYYDPQIKEDRLKQLDNDNFTNIRTDLEDLETINQVFEKYKPEIVINLAAQAGVRYSIENPHAYISSNIVGFKKILEACRHHIVKHLIYKLFRSVYGAHYS